MPLHASRESRRYRLTQAAGRLYYRFPSDITSLIYRLCHWTLFQTPQERVDAMIEHQRLLGELLNETRPKDEVLRDVANTLL